MDVEANSPESFKVLTTNEARALAAIADRIFPKTDTPGAVEIGALRYIDTALTGDYASLVPLYRRGIRAVDLHSRAKYGAAFGDLGDRQRDEILTDFEAGRVATFKKAAEFFEAVRYHVLEGVFCEPHYGGNKGMVGWRLVNFPGQQFGYADAYINKPVDLEPVAIDDRKTREK
jgi:gluconate 2-dehydrogenase gamma chain